MVSGHRQTRYRPKKRSQALSPGGAGGSIGTEMRTCSRARALSSLATQIEDLPGAGRIDPAIWIKPNSEGVLNELRVVFLWVCAGSLVSRRWASSRVAPAPRPNGQR
jgi:hypothetical protein